MPSAHPWPIRLTHWIAAFAMVCMILSGWQIYDASPIFAFVFPPWSTLGGWLGAGIAWHFAAMYLLFGALLVYLTYGFATGHFRDDVRPTGPRALVRDVVAALTFRLRHRSGHYNAVQRLLYSVVIVAMTISVLSGLAMWKPAQLAPLAWLFGDYPTARVIHFFAMSVAVLFLVVHVVLVVLFPSTLVSMITGGRREALDPDDAPDAPGAGIAE